MYKQRQGERERQGGKGAVKGRQAYKTYSKQFTELLLLDSTPLCPRFELRSRCLCCEFAATTQIHMYIVIYIHDRLSSYNNAAYYCRNMLGYRSSRFNFFIMSLIYCTCCTTKHTHNPCRTQRPPCRTRTQNRTQTQTTSKADATHLGVFNNNMKCSQNKEGEEPERPHRCRIATV